MKPRAILIVNMEEGNNFDFSALTGEQKLGKLWEKLCHVDHQTNIVNNSLDDLKGEIKKIDTRVEKCEGRYTELLEQINTMKITVNDLQQSALDCDVIVRNVREIEGNEDELLTIAQLILQKINVSVLPHIAAIKRLGRKIDGNNKSRPILLTFNSIDEKNSVMAAKRKMAIKCSDVQLENVAVGSGNEFIYFDEHLTKHTADLYYAARQLRKRQLIKYVWIRRGKLYAKRRDGDQPTRITDMLKINELAKRKFNSTPNATGADNEMIIDDTVSEVYDATTIMNDPKKLRQSGRNEIRGGGGGALML